MTRTRRPVAANFAARHRSVVVTILAAILSLAAAMPTAAAETVRVGDLTIRPGDVPRRLTGYGLVAGLDGTGDRSFNSSSFGNPTVRSVINLLRRFQIELPSDRLRLRNVAAVLVTAEISPYLRAGGRFDVQVSAMGDATSLRGGVLWIAPLVADPGEPPVATAQGPLLVADEGGLSYAHRGNSARIPGGGALEIDPPAMLAAEPTLLLKNPDLGTAGRIADAVNAAEGTGSAKVVDPGAVALTPQGNAGGDLNAFLAAVETLTVSCERKALIIINAREGSVVAGGDQRVGAAMINHHGITLQIGGAAAEGAPVEGLVRVEPQASVQDVAAGLQAAGVNPREMAAIFEALQSVGALSADVVVR